MTIIASGTGHRPNKLLYGYANSNKDHSFLSDLLANLLDFYQVDRVKSGMALGFDLALASAAVSVGIPYIAVLPFPGFGNNWNTDDQNRLLELLEVAEHIHLVYNDDPKEYRDAVIMLQHRNQVLVENSDLLFCLWNGSKGGTANCIKYAQKYNKSRDATNKVHLISLWKMYESKVNLMELRNDRT